MHLNDQRNYDIRMQSRSLVNGVVTASHRFIGLIRTLNSLNKYLQSDECKPIIVWQPRVCIENRMSSEKTPISSCLTCRFLYLSIGPITKLFFFLKKSHFKSLYSTLTVRFQLHYWFSLVECSTLGHHQILTHSVTLASCIQHS